MRVGARHFRRSLESIHSDLDRFEQHGLEGITDKPRPGRPLKITGEIRAFIRERLQEERLWHAEALSEEIKQKFRVEVSSETVRQHLYALGYTWKRARYSPAKTLDPELEQEHRASLETLKRGHWTAN